MEDETQGYPYSVGDIHLASSDPDEANCKDMCKADATAYANATATCHRYLKHCNQRMAQVSRRVPRLTAIAAYGRVHRCVCDNRWSLDRGRDPYFD